MPSSSNIGKKFSNSFSISWKSTNSHFWERDESPLFLCHENNWNGFTRVLIVHLKNGPLIYSPYHLQARNCFLQLPSSYTMEYFGLFLYQNVIGSIFCQIKQYLTSKRTLIASMKRTSNKNGPKTDPWNTILCILASRKIAKFDLELDFRDFFHFKEFPLFSLSLVLMKFFAS